MTKAAASRVTSMATSFARPRSYSWRKWVCSKWCLCFNSDIPPNYYADPTWWGVSLELLSTFHWFQWRKKLQYCMYRLCLTFCVLVLLMRVLFAKSCANIPRCPPSFFFLFSALHSASFSITRDCTRSKAMASPAITGASACQATWKWRRGNMSVCGCTTVATPSTPFKPNRALVVTASTPTSVSMLTNIFPVTMVSVGVSSTRTYKHACFHE